METYHGHVRTPADAIVLFEACRLGLLPRVQRRLSEKERQNIKSGSVFVWDEREAGMRRWTDGKSWSASRVSGSFLTYREMEGKRGGGSGAFAPPAASLAAGRAGKSPNLDGSDSDGMDAEGPDGYRYKADGLMKQSFSITTATHQKLHLISYYARSHPSSQNLIQPTQDQALKHIRPVKGMYPESTVHEQQNVPVVTRAPMISSMPHHSSMPPGFAHRPGSSVSSGGGGGGGGGGSSGSNSGSSSGSAASNGVASNGVGANGGPATGATHPASYQVHHHPYGWPPSPVATPPTTVHGVVHYSLHTLTAPPPPPPPPPPAHSRSGSPMSYSMHSFPMPSSQPGGGGSPRLFDRPTLPQLDGLPTHPPPPTHRGSLGSPLGSMQPNQVQRQQQQQRSTPPMSLPPPHMQSNSSQQQQQQQQQHYDEGGRFSSPTGSTNSVANNPSAGCAWDVIPLRGSPGPVDAEAAARLGLNVQDIPNEKLGFDEDVRALRVLDRAFAA